MEVVVTLVPPPITDTCSEETQNAAWKLYYKNSDGMGVGLDLDNKRSFLKNVADWLSANQ